MSHCTIVIPCFNEAGRLDISTIIRYATSHDHLLLFVNDGSVDATADILDDLVAADPEHLAVLHLASNGGKAEAVRQGMLHARARRPQYVGYWDADLATPLDTIDEFVTYLDTHRHVNIVLGARVRLLGKQIERSVTRHCLGRLFAAAAAATLRLPVYDTQCGAKLVRATEQTSTLFDAPFLTRWLFDVELLARYLASTSVTADGPPVASTIHELPLTQWRDVEGSKVKPTDFLRAVWQLAVIYRTYRPGGQPYHASSVRREVERQPAPQTDRPTPKPLPSDTVPRNPVAHSMERQR